MRSADEGPGRAGGGTHRGRRPSRIEILLALVLAAVLVVRYGPEIGARAGLNVPAADLEMVTLSGDTLRLTDLRGTVVVVNVWATWCGPCLTEMPMLQRVWEDHRERGLRLVGLSVDEGPISDFVAGLRRRGVEFPLALAPPGAARVLGFGGTVPTTVVIDREGRIAEHVVGVVDEAELRRMLGRLLE